MLDNPTRRERRRVDGAGERLLLGEAGDVQFDGGAEEVGEAGRRAAFVGVLGRRVRAISGMESP
ncbi:hypothetical protein ACXJJ3_30490 [Kribbella sp. WER1]